MRREVADRVEDVAEQEEVGPAAAGEAVGAEPLLQGGVRVRLDVLAVGGEQVDDGAQLAVAHPLEAHVLLPVGEEEGAALPEARSRLEIVHEAHICEDRGIQRSGGGEGGSAAGITNRKFQKGFGCGRKVCLQGS